MIGKMKQHSSALKNSKKINETALECAEEFKEDLTLPFEINPLGEEP